MADTIRKTLGKNARRKSQIKLYDSISILWQQGMGTKSYYIGPTRWQRGMGIKQARFEQNLIHGNSVFALCQRM